MAKIQRQVGSTSQVLEVFAQDSSASTGVGLAGLLFNTASLTAYYKRNKGTASVVISLVTITTFGTYVSGGFKEVDATNMKGIIEFHPPDAAFVAGADSVVFYIQGAANLAPIVLEVELTANNNQDAVRGGMTALPNAAAEAAGGLYTRGTGAGQIRQDSNGRIDGNLKAWLDTAPSALIAGRVDVNTQATASGLTFNLTGSISGSIGSVGSVTNLGAGAQTDVQSAMTAQGYTSAKALFLTGDAFARLGAPAGASISADIAAVKGETDTILTDVNTGAGALYNRIGAPAGASLAADVAANFARLGTPAGASHAADVAAVKTQTDLINTTTNNNAIANAILDLAAAVDGRTLRQILKIIAAATVGTEVHPGGNVVEYWAINASKARVTADLTTGVRVVTSVDGT